MSYKNPGAPLSTLRASSGFFHRPSSSLSTVLSSSVFNTNLCWMYTQLTGEIIAPLIKKELKACRICKYFDDLYDMINNFTKSDYDVHMHTITFLYNIFNIRLPERAKKNISSLACFEIKEIVDKVYVSVFFEYQKCTCYKKKQVIKEEEEKEK